MSYQPSTSSEYEAICPKGDGGNSTLANQDEQVIHNRTETAALVRVRTEGLQDGEAH